MDCLPVVCYSLCIILHVGLTSQKYPVGGTTAEQKQAKFYDRCINSFKQNKTCHLSDRSAIKCSSYSKLTAVLIGAQDTGCETQIATVAV